MPGKLHASLHSLLVVRHGYLVLESYYHPYTRETPHPLASVTKSVLGMLTGIAVDEGEIRRVEQPVLKYFPDQTIAALDERKEAVTIEHLLTMGETQLFGLLRDFILPSIQANAALPANPNGVARIAASVRKAADPLQPVPPLPAAAGEISGQVIPLETNPWGSRRSPCALCRMGLRLLWPWTAARSCRLG